MFQKKKSKKIVLLTWCRRGSYCIKVMTTKEINKISLKSAETYIFRYDKNKTMSLGCDTGFACVRFTVLPVQA